MALGAADAAEAALDDAVAASPAPAAPDPALQAAVSDARAPQAMHVPSFIPSP
jgi:hypothetical protein